MNKQQLDDERMIAWLKLHALVNHPERLEFDHGFDAGIAVVMEFLKSSYAIDHDTYIKIVREFQFKDSDEQV